PTASRLFVGITAGYICQKMLNVRSVDPPVQGVATIPNVHPIQAVVNTPASLRESGRYFVSKAVGV
ncbi:hypothetical protein, partial [Paraburkholderia humisilvae]|uniref:hypothetical protein n=1 Tax=Paraburkholderia humisilvae TaxID=627669 RepID=UPI001C2EDC5A